MRYIIGIDLGTTNCCVAYVDTEKLHQGIQNFKIPQLKSAGVIEKMAVLPSFCYLSSPNELPAGSLDLPWKKGLDYCIGSFAKSQGMQVPTRLVQSAKSWLTLNSPLRRDPILPFEAASEAIKISPVEATARYLTHIKESWNESFKGNAEAEFDSQEIILTVPASFDEVARLLTVEAAKKAGFIHMTLLEEPQAAFYSWIAHHQEMKFLKPGHLILICDVGGGTTDFSLIEVKEQNGLPSFMRMAVGQHLLLGGDNMDAALSLYLEGKLKKEDNLSLVQQLQIKQEARKCKEELLSGMHEVYRFVCQGFGSSVIQGSLTCEIARKEVLDLLMEGFFGSYEWEEACRLKKAGGLKTMGLPYENEPSITKHLAGFLQQNAGSRPDFVLFNGGAMKPEPFRIAILNQLKKWFDKPVQELDSISLDLAVAKGAAYFGKAKRNLGLRIQGGSPRSYYLAIQARDKEKGLKQKAMTLLGRGQEEGTRYESEEVFYLIPNMPVSFQLYTSHVRLHDAPGSVVDIDESELQPLPPIHTILRYGKARSTENEAKELPVKLSIGHTEIGTLEVFLQSKLSSHRWNLEFQLRTHGGLENALNALEKTRTDETFDVKFVENAEQAIFELYCKESKQDPARIIDRLEEKLQLKKSEWPLSVLRKLADSLLKAASYRSCSIEHEARFWNLLGFLLRPGIGYPLDDFRTKEVWKLNLSDSKIQKAMPIQLQRWICYRRIAGGLNKGQQMQLASELNALLFDKKTGRIQARGKTEEYQHLELIRAAGALELIDIPLKVKLGEAILNRICEGSKAQADYWALGRIGARNLLHGTLLNAIPRGVCEGWIERLLTCNSLPEEQVLFVFRQLASKTDHRELNISENLSDRVAARFPVLADLLAMKMGQKERELSYGESLPLGLIFDLK